MVFYAKKQFGADNHNYLTIVVFRRNSSFIEIQIFLIDILHDFLFEVKFRVILSVTGQFMSSNGNTYSSLKEIHFSISSG